MKRFAPMKDEEACAKNVMSLGESVTGCQPVSRGQMT
jgi:hypothetical protein